MRLFSRPARTAPHQRSAYAYGDASDIPSNGMAGLIAAGTVVSERSALQIATVMSCVRELAGDLAGTPLEEQELQADGRWRTVTPSPLVEDPFIDVDPVIGWFQVMASELLRGNSWNRVVERDKLMRPTKLLPLHPDTVQARMVAGRRQITVDRQTVPTADVLHIPGIVMPGAWVGLDPIQYAAQSFGIALATETYGAQFFANGTVVSGVLQSEQVLDEATVKRTLQLWRKQHQGLRNAHAPAVLGNGLQWKPMTVAPNEAQFLETRDYQRHEIAGLFGVRPDRIGAVAKHASQGGGRGNESRELDYVKHTIRFWAARIESAVSRHLPPGRRARFNLKDLLRGDPAARASFYSAGRAGAWLLIDDIRVEEGYDPLPDGRGQDAFAPLNSAHSDGTSTASGEPRDDDTQEQQ